MEEIKETTAGKIRILHVLSALHTGGVESMLLSYYSHMNREKVHFDFVVNRESIGCLEYWFLELGSEVYHIPALREDKPGHRSALRKILKARQYDGIHFHMGFYACFDVLLARRCMPKTFIFLHSHIAFEPLSLPMRAVKAFLSRLARQAADIWCACGNDAGIYLFGKRAVQSRKVSIIPNAIDLDRFRFNEEFRERYRAEFKLDEKFVIGNIGRLTFQKNQQFLIKVFQRVHEIMVDSVLVLIGAGEDEPIIRESIRELGLEDCIHIVGARTDANAFYNAFDLFALPSRFEGLGITLIEAQANGLTSLASDRVPREVKQTDSLEFLPLNEELWVDRILAFGPRQTNKRDCCEAMKGSRYDILHESMQFEQFYFDSIGKR